MQISKKKYNPQVGAKIKDARISQGNMYWLPRITVSARAECTGYQGLQYQPGQHVLATKDYSISQGRI